ncbi:MAG: DNA-directed RNA polymerase subunit omega [Sulfurospirillaceae bacterium]|jgi:DNA-directed RNA polymerase subunit omega|nr:DNA-directed RNA polymerase subunit omega [Sulfurospirillaceae bacterium]MCK9545787.1 DNA-directed RNA polymerase subunit omega [Sulfurospirillaceae bacterium]MDY0237613.1 DNA-directed RNA polymerase subunit omega [Campylobacterales bacterium]NLM98966.1 DNA-directed RNA polymerase subunit omega [Campylobacteraceae bacterium]
MRTERLVAQAMDRLNGDRYKLSLAVAKRAETLSLGATPLVEVDKAKYKFTDIALMEIAQGKIGIDSIAHEEE